MARSLVARELAKLGAQAIWREGTTTDNGNWILDLHGLSVGSPDELERRIETIPGVVCSGIFAQNAATRAFLAKGDGVGAREMLSRKGVDFVISNGQGASWLGGLPEMNVQNTLTAKTSWLTIDYTFITPRMEI